MLLSVNFWFVNYVLEVILFGIRVKTNKSVCFRWMFSEVIQVVIPIWYDLKSTRKISGRY
ncbi:hypothetical protein DMA11_12890 [Marinilabiliaceae bacterium JC017]|nr:hypothetical protein DMA11_12890 [Marinilabiliaceae bacterium JC017]